MEVELVWTKLLEAIRQLMMKKLKKLASPTTTSRLVYTQAELLKQRESDWQTKHLV